MRRPALFFVAVAGVACGLRAVGSAPDDGGVGPDGASSADAAIADGTADGAIVPGDDGGDIDVFLPDGGRPPRVAGAVALYTFDEDSGTVAHDTSGAAPLDLVIGGAAATSWTGRALAIDGGSVLLDSNANATRIVTACKASNEVSLEAWVVPADTTQGASSPARIAGLTADTSTLDVSLSAYGSSYLFRLRTSASNESANDIFSDGGMKTALTHVVLTRAANGLRRTYVDGQVLVESSLAGDLSTWSDYAIAVANEHNSTRPWFGELHLVAFYARALTAAEVKQNFVAGEGP